MRFFHFATLVLMLLIAAPCQADLVLNIDFQNTQPGPIVAGDLLTFDIVASFEDDTTPGDDGTFVDFITLDLDGSGVTTAALENGSFQRFDTQDVNDGQGIFELARTDGFLDLVSPDPFDNNFTLNDNQTATLGQLTIDTTGLAAGTYDVGFLSNDAFASTDSGDPLGTDPGDEFNVSDIQFTITAIPEPSSFLSLLLGGLAVTQIRRRRKG